MVWGAVASAIGGVTGALIGAYGNHQSAKSVAKKQYNYDTKLQEQNIKWQKEAMKNSHQWEVEDLKKAGLNPAISANGGASTGGASASQSGHAMPITDYASIIQNGISSAINMYNDSRKTDTDITKGIAETGKLEAETAGTILNNELVEKYGDKEKNNIIANTLQDTAMKSAETAKKVEEANRIKGGKTAEVAGTATTAKIEKAIKDAEIKEKKNQKKRLKKEAEINKKGYFDRLFHFEINKND